VILRAPAVRTGKIAEVGYEKLGDNRVWYLSVKHLDNLVPYGYQIGRIGGNDTVPGKVRGPDRNWGPESGRSAGKP